MPPGPPPIPGCAAWRLVGGGCLSPSLRHSGPSMHPVPFGAVRSPYPGRGPSGIPLCRPQRPSPRASAGCWALALALALALAPSLATPRSPPFPLSPFFLFSSGTSSCRPPARPRKCMVACTSAGRGRRKTHASTRKATPVQRPSAGPVRSGPPAPPPRGPPGRLASTEHLPPALPPALLLLLLLLPRDEGSVR